MERYYNPDISKDTWCGRKDANENEYIYQLIQCKSLNDDESLLSGYGLLGFNSDTGIERNQGRRGAALGPQFFRQCFGKITAPHAIPLFDFGNIQVLNDNLEEAQVCLGEKIHQILKTHIFPIVIGGGHETAWGHYQGIKSHFPNDDIAILNFDAHFDLRPLMPKQLGTSGTPFRQIYHFLNEKEQTFHYYCAGIQPLANTKSLFDFAHQHHVQYQFAHEINTNPLDLSFIRNIIQKHSKIYVTICLDVFSASIAPGVSAPQALGIQPTFVIEALKIIKQSQKAVSLDIVELSPPLDINNHTAKLAASLVAGYIFG
ncbi:MAG: formimidoylglutamase [Gammaproteobacteria bacterium]|nr:formimidoylglutamase [Gammaproteobacteria bacterium]